MHYTTLLKKEQDKKEIQEGLLKDREEMVHKLEAENTLLDNISKKDELTGILNRLGFMTKAYDLLKENVGRRAMILYADLNYLKRINDTFSHSEGNYALITCAQTLEKVMKENAVVGRIGGDEFAAFMILDDEDAYMYKSAAKEHLDFINKTNGKPYPVTFSIGYHEFIIQKKQTLKEVISLADEQLYKDKNMKPPFEG